MFDAMFIVKFPYNNISNHIRGFKERSATLLSVAIKKNEFGYDYRKKYESVRCCLQQ